VVGSLDRKLWRELKSTGFVLLAVGAIMAIGIAAYVALASAYRNLTTAQRLYYAECRMADFSVELKKAPLTDVAGLADLPGVVELRPRIQFFATVDLENVIEPINGLVLSLPNRREPVINDIVLRQGGYFTDVRDNEVIVNEAFARQHQLFPGGMLHLLLNNRRQELFIVGTAISSEFTYLVGPGSIVPDAKRFGVFYVKQTFAEEVFDMQGACNQVVGRLSPHEAEHPQETLRLAELKLDDYGVLNAVPLRDQPSNRFLSNEIKGLRAFGVINPAIFLMVAAMVLNVLLSRLAEQQRTVVGTLKALGYSNGAVARHFLKFGLIVGAASGLAGCGLGHWLAGGMTAMYQTFFQFPALANRVYPDVVGTGIVIGIVCGMFGSLHGAWNVLRLDPAVAMRPKPPPIGGAVFLERFPRFWKSLSFASRMTLRNVLRQRLRTAAGIFAAAMGSMLSVDALLLFYEMQHMVDFQFQLVQRSDLDLGFKDEQGREALDEALHLPAVDRAEPLFDVACTFVSGSHSRKGGITGVPAGGTLTIPRDEAGHPLRIPSSGLLLTRKMAELLQVGRGDTVEVRPTKGLREPRQVEVVEIADSFLGIAVYADADFLARLVGEESALTGVQLLLNPEPAAKAALFHELKELPGVQSVTARTDIITNVRETLVKNQRVFIGLLVAFAGMIFFGSVLNSSLVSLAERRREVATLRVLGYGPWQIGALFLRESVLTNGIGTLVGLPLGYLLNYGITLAYDTEMFRIPLIDPTGVWCAVVLLGTGFGLAAHLFVQRSIHRMDWLDALNARE
jgi:putative ABC transport system permease protein